MRVSETTVVSVPGWIRPGRCARARPSRASSTQGLDSRSCGRPGPADNRAQLEHVIRAAAAIVDDAEIVVVGSQAVLGQFPDAPPELLVSNGGGRLSPQPPGENRAHRRRHGRTVAVSRHLRLLRRRSVTRDGDAARELGDPSRWCSRSGRLAGARFRGSAWKSTTCACRSGWPAARRTTSSCELPYATSWSSCRCCCGLATLPVPPGRLGELRTLIEAAFRNPE